MPATPPGFSRCQLDCAVLCRCHFFGVGSGTNFGLCNWQDDACTSFVDSAYHVYKITPVYRLRKAAHECSGSETQLSTTVSVEGCAHLCAETSSCLYFLAGSGQYAGRCWHETNSCTGYSSNSELHVYELVPITTRVSQTATATVSCELCEL